ncbi:MAG: FAD:protein FMN transferase [Acidobacteriota bacterium]
MFSTARTLIACLLAAFAQATTSELARYEFEQPRMGTIARIVLYASSREVAERAARAAFERVARLDAIMSDYDETSELNRLSRSPFRWVAVSEDLFRVLSVSQSLARQTDGAFDITVGRMVRLWRRARRTGEMPARSMIEEARKATGYKLVRLDARTGSVKLLRDGMMLDLGGIAKGYAADEALKAIRGEGVRSAMVAIGGDIAMSDPPPGKRGWTIAVSSVSTKDTKDGKDTISTKDTKDEKDTKREEEMETLLLSDCGVSTSGDLEQWVEIGGVRYSHIVDPRTGLGVTGRMSATVVASSAMMSDALATAACVLAPRRALRVIESRGAECLIVRQSEKGTERYESRRWKGLNRP